MSRLRAMFDLPQLVAAPEKIITRMQDLDEGNGGLAGTIDKAYDACRDGVTCIGMRDDADLHIDDKKGCIRANGKSRHRRYPCTEVVRAGITRANRATIRAPSRNELISAAGSSSLF